MIVEFYYIPWRTSWEYCLEISDLRFINSWYIYANYQLPNYVIGSASPRLRNGCRAYHNYLPCI